MGLLYWWQKNKWKRYEHNAKEHFTQSNTKWKVYARIKYIWVHNLLRLFCAAYFSYVRICGYLFISCDCGFKKWSIVNLRTWFVPKLTSFHVFSGSYNGFMHSYCISLETLTTDQMLVSLYTTSFYPYMYLRSEKTIQKQMKG